MSEVVRMNEGSPGTVKWPGGPSWALFVKPWDRWARTFPPSLAVSADAFVKFVLAVHPWALRIEPRLQSTAWVREVVGVE